MISVSLLAKMFMLNINNGVMIISIHYRDEQRGVGGLFFDDLNKWDFETCFKYIQAVNNGYLAAILPILKSTVNNLIPKHNVLSNCIVVVAMLRYNLVYDRGTLFGLQTGGRIESILVSLPNLAGWSYRPEWDADSAEKRLADYYLKPKWLGLNK